MHVIRVPFLAVVCLCLFAFPAAIAAASDEPANAIHLDVVAAPRGAGPVEGLTAQDFTLFDNGKPQPVTSFMPDKNDLEQTKVIIVVDAVNTSYDRLAYTRLQLEHFFTLHKGHLPYPTSLSLITETSVKLQAGASTNESDLQNDLKQLQIGIRQEGRSAGFYGATDRLRISLNALERVLLQLNTAPGRKVVIWLSPGWALFSGPNVEIDSKQQKYLFNEIMRLSTLLRESRVSLYAVDTLGTEEVGTFHAFLYRDFLKPVKRWQDAQIGDVSLQVLAYNSGGLVLNSSNDIAGMIQTAMNNAEPFYTLSFMPQPSDGPGEYHAIQVKVNKPEITARTNPGYYAKQ